MLLHQGFSGSLRHRCVSADELSVCQEGIEEGEGTEGWMGERLQKQAEKKLERERKRGIGVLPPLRHSSLSNSSRVGTQLPSLWISQGFNFLVIKFLFKKKYSAVIFNTL